MCGLRKDPTRSLAAATALTWASTLEQVRAGQRLQALQWAHSTDLIVPGAQRLSSVIEASSPNPSERRLQNSWAPTSNSSWAPRTSLAQAPSPTSPFAAKTALGDFRLRRARKNATA